jgi:hypothetical protein
MAEEVTVDPLAQSDEVNGASSATNATAFGKWQQAFYHRLWM